MLYQAQSLYSAMEMRNILNKAVTTHLNWQKKTTKISG
jgi:hypothetical protein